MLCSIVPAISISSEDCVDLWSDGGTVGHYMDIPEGYSLKDQLTVRGQILPLEDVSGRRLFVGFVNSSSLEYTMYTTLSPKGKLVVKTRQHDDVLKIDGQVTPGVNNSLLLRMICNETTCSVTSPGNLNVESFNHQQTLPDLLSTDRIRVMANEEDGEILRVHSITFCEATQPDTDTGNNRDSGGDESGGDESEKVCKFLGQNITTRQVIKFPDNFNMSDVLTVKANRGTAENGYLFYLFKYGQYADKWRFYLHNAEELHTLGVYQSDPIWITTSVQGIRSVIKFQVFNNMTADTLSIITPNSTIKINSSLDMILQFNTIEIKIPLTFGSYEYISICRPLETVCTD